MSPQEIADFVFNNPYQLELTAQPAKCPTSPPIMYDIWDNGRIVATLHRDDYRVVLVTGQAAMAESPTASVMVGNVARLEKPARPTRVLL